MPHMARMLSGKLSTVRLGFFLTFLVLVSFTYLLVTSRGLLTASPGSRAVNAGFSSSNKPAASRVGGPRGSRRDAVVPIQCKDPPGQSEIMAMTPIKYLKNYKNPCWWERLEPPISDLYANNGFNRYSYAVYKMFDQIKKAYAAKSPAPKFRLRCLPYFLLAGQPKCGSTDIYERLVAHPDIAPGPIKESHWWGKNRYGLSLNFTRTIPLKEYVDLFDRAAIRIKKIKEVKEDESGDRITYYPAITGDASVSTLWSNDDWWKNPENCGLTEPLYTNAHHVYKLIPQARILVILRNPVDRLYSDFLYFQKRLKAQDLFQAATKGAISALHDCESTSSLRACLYNHTIFSKSRARLRVGVYHTYLQDWLSVFPRDQIFVIRLEDYAAAPLRTIRQVNKFLGLRALSEEEAEGVLEKPVINSRRASDRKLGKMLPETRAMLEDFYGPHNVKLARLLQDDRFLWEDGAP